MKQEHLTYQSNLSTSQILFNASYEQRLSAWRKLRNNLSTDDGIKNVLGTFYPPKQIFVCNEFSKIFRLGNNLLIVSVATEICMAVGNVSLDD